MSLFCVQGLSVTLQGKNILTGIDLTLETGKITSVIGPNGSGKSTLLKVFSKVLSPSGGTVQFNGRNLTGVSSREMARHMAVLFQSSRAPGDVTVRELVEYGRFPHQRWWKGVTDEDRGIVDWALSQTSLENLADRTVTTLSGGEQQRAWIAMALAQQPETLILDEPTTYLDIAHQLEILQLVRRLNRDNGISVIMVLHDLNHAAKYSDYLVVLRQGRLVAAGTPLEVVTEGMLRDVFAVEADFWQDRDNIPVFVAHGLAEKGIAGEGND